MNGSSLALVLGLAIGPAIVRDRPLQPAVSPDGQVTATTRVPQSFATPEGADYSLLLNGKLVYPARAKRFWFSSRAHWHTFLSEFAWSPDSQAVAFIEKVYNWEYSDPYNRDFDGTESNRHLYLTIVSRNGQAKACELHHVPERIQLDWTESQELRSNEQKFELAKDPPKPVN